MSHNVWMLYIQYMYIPWWILWYQLLISLLSLFQPFWSSIVRACSYRLKWVAFTARIYLGAMCSQKKACYSWLLILLILKFQVLPYPGLCVSLVPQEISVLYVWVSNSRMTMRSMYGYIPDYFDWGCLQHAFFQNLDIASNFCNLCCMFVKTVLISQLKTAQLFMALI